jgi:hypothetical protein
MASKIYGKIIFACLALSLISILLKQYSGYSNPFIALLPNFFILLGLILSLPFVYKNIKFSKFVRTSTFLTLGSLTYQLVYSWPNMQLVGISFCIAASAFLLALLIHKRLNFLAEE